MKNTFNKNPLITFFGGLFCCFILFASCDNFLNGDLIKTEIEQAIAYNNAKEITVLLQPVQGTGSTLPSGNTKVKQGYDFEISFLEDPQYSFVKWTAVTNDKAETPVTDGIVFENAASSVTKVKITNDTVAIKLVPVCEKRIVVSDSSLSPSYFATGVSWNSPIHAEFTKAVKPESFIFDAKEIPEGAQTKTDDKGNIWAYILEEQTYFKNITITDANGFSLAEYYDMPQVTGTNLTILASTVHSFEFATGETLKTIVVTLSNNITDSGNIKMAEGKSWRYIINSSTNEKASVNFFAAQSEGSVNAVSRDYSLGQKIKISFTENADYQFIRWDYDKTIIAVEEPNSNDTAAVVLKATENEATTTIKAICAPRLRVTAFEPVNDKDHSSVSKNESIKITFNQKLPTDDEGRAQLDNISITVGGSPVKTSFAAPDFLDQTDNSNIIIIKADKSNMLDVQEGQTRTVAVTIPADFYYKLQDGTKVYYGGVGKTYDYKIDNTTVEKAKVTYRIINGESATDTEFNPATAAGSIENQPAYKEYNIGEQVSVSFAEKPGYQFFAWKLTQIKEGGQRTPVTNQITYYKDFTYKHFAPTFVMNTEGEYEISAICYKRPSVSVDSVSPYNANSATEFAKNVPIVITFDHEIKAETKDDIKVYYSGLSDFSKTAYYNTSISSDNKTVTLTPKTMLPVEHSYETVTVTVPCDKIFYYAQNGNTQITCGSSDFTWSFRINNATMNRTTIRFATDDAAISGKQIRVDGTYLSSGSSQPINVEQSWNLEFPLSAENIFAGWKIDVATSGYTVSSNNYETRGPITVSMTDPQTLQNEIYFILNIDETTPEKATLYSYNAIGNGSDGYGINISAKDIIRPVVESVKINNTMDIFNTISNSCDSKIYINFNKEIDTTTVPLTQTGTLTNTGSISITKEGVSTLHYEEHFFAEWTNENKTLILSPKNSITELVPKESDIFSFVIKLNANGTIQDTMGYPIQVSSGINNSFEIGYRINGQRETDLPSITTYSVSNKRNGTALVEDVYSTWTDASFAKNHLSKSLYFEIQGNDDKSGVQYLRISETHYDYTNGEPDSSPFVSYYYPATQGVKSYLFKNTHKFKAANDGLIKIDFEVVDMAGNASTALSYYIIKDTGIIVQANGLDRDPKELLDHAFKIIDPDHKYRNRISETEEEVIFPINESGLRTCKICGWTKKLYLKVIYSYDETYFDEKNNLIEFDKNNGTYRFVHNPLKTTYLKVVVYDDIGNESSYIRFIPACPDFSEDSLIYASEDSVYIINPDDLSFYKSLINKYDCPSSVMSVRFYRNDNLYTNDSGKEWCKRDNSDPLQLLTYVGGGLKPSDFVKEKDYYINICAIIGVPPDSNNPQNLNEVYFESVISDTTLLFQLDADGKISKKVIGSVNSGGGSGFPIQPGTLVQDAYPDALNIKSIKPIINTGTCDVLVENFKMDKAFEYQIRVRTYKDNTFLDFPVEDGKKIILNLPTPATYDSMQLVLTDRNNGRRYITDSLLSADLVLDKDSTAPVFTDSVQGTITFPFAFAMRHSDWPSGSLNEIITGHPIDEKSGMYKNDQGLGELEYWILPNYATVYTQYATYTEEELLKEYAASRKTITYDYNQMNYKLPHKLGYHQSTIEIPLDGLDEGFYTICIKGKDISENYAYYFQPLYNRLLNEKLLYSCPSQGQISFDNPHNVFNTESVSYYYFDNEDNNDNAPGRWIYIQTSSNIHHSDSSTVEIPGALRGRWGRLVGFKSNEGQANPATGYYDIEYVYIDYLRYKGKGAPNEIFVKQKNVIPGLNGLQIYCDQPTLVHTLYCSKKLSETSEEEDIAVWENKGIETGVVIKDELFTYSKDNYYDSIPSGAYYTTVVHFVDGTKVMSEVKQKP